MSDASCMATKFDFSLRALTASTYALETGLKQKMLNSSLNYQTSISPKGIRKLSFRRTSSNHIQTGNEQCALPAIFPEKRNKVKSLRQSGDGVSGAYPIKVKALEHQIDIGDEKSDLLGYEVFSGRLALCKKAKTKHRDEQKGSETGNSHSIDVKLASKALAWGSHVLHLEDVISLAGFRMEVVKTTYAGYARDLARTVDFSKCPDGSQWSLE